MAPEDFEDIFRNPTPALRRKMSAVGLRGVELADEGDPYDGECGFNINITLGKPFTKKEIENGEWGNLSPDGSVSFDLAQLPGCCGVLVVSELGFDPRLPPAVVDLVMGEFWNEIQRDSGWGNLIVATTIDSQKQFAGYLKRAKFKVTATSINPRTHNLVTMWGKDLKPPRGKKPPRPFRITPTYRAAGW